MLVEEGDSAGKQIHVMASDTRVEAPNVSKYLLDTLDGIQEGAAAAHLGVTVHLVQPAPNESFWAKLLGSGYPSPTRWFRWCTSSMKIKPMRRAIEKITHQYGSVILLLGTRIDESSERGRRIQGRELTADGLNPHHEIPNALVATPIAKWTTDQVWDYLYTHNPPPWGGSHNFLLDLYRQASGGECPVVLDISTPSCGGSRFGCWTCTVVKQDKSMQGFIRSGETGLIPLNQFRDKLKHVRELAEWRTSRRRDGSLGQGPFLPERRIDLLRELLELEQKTGMLLIADDELLAIQKVWSNEFDVKTTAIQMAVEYGRKLPAMNQVNHSSVEQQVLDELLADSGLAPDLVDRCC